MPKIYSPLQWLAKGIFLVLLGLTLFGSCLTIRVRRFPGEKPVKIVAKDLKTGETCQADGVELAPEDIEATEKGNGFVQYDCVL